MTKKKAKTTKQPRVSIIIVTYNRPELLRQAIQSVKDQTEPNIECILIDNGSTKPEVQDVIKEHALPDNRFRIFRNEENFNNISFNWNQGIDFSTGKYITTLDDDNKKRHDFCKKMADWLDEHPDYYSVACHFQVMQGNVLTDSVWDRPSYINNENILEGNYVDSGCMMYRRELIDLIGYYDETITTCEDWEFVIRAQRNTPKGFGCIPEPLFLYRWHETNRTFEAAALGDERNKQVIKSRDFKLQKRLLLYHQVPSKLTLSQNNVLNGIRSALETIPYLTIHETDVEQIYKNKPEYFYDFVFIVAPFSMDTVDSCEVRRYARDVLHFHIEDPQAVNINTEHARFASYMSSNDISVIEHYEQTIGNGMCCFCPSLSFDDINLKADKQIPVEQKYDYDVVFFGHAYDSRRGFVQVFESKLKKAGIKKYRIMGGGWDKQHNGTGELSQEKAFELLNKSKLIVLMNRDKLDLGGAEDHVTPQSVDRGYFEMASNGLVMLDKSRSHHSFNVSENDPWISDEMVFYEDANDLIDKIKYYLKNETERKTMVDNAKKSVIEKFTYQVRMRKLMQVLRSRRIYQEIQ